MSAGLFILDGHEPVDVGDDHERWAAQWHNRDARRVALTTVGEAEVSTIFLGIDHSFGFGQPILFETMVFGGDLDGEQWRYHTWDQAEAGHARIVARIEAGQDPEKSH